LNSQAGTKLPRRSEKPKKETAPKPETESVENLNDLGILKIQKEREAILEKQIKNQKARGELVDKKAVSQIFNKLWSVDSSQLTPIATKLAPEIASICSVDDPEIITQIRKKIDTEIWRVLGHSKRLMSDYLAKIAADNLEDEQDNDHS
jgi:hypothetical protein